MLIQKLLDNIGDMGDILFGIGNKNVIKIHQAFIVLHDLTIPDIPFPDRFVVVEVDIRQEVNRVIATVHQMLRRHDGALDVICTHAGQVDTNNGLIHQDKGVIAHEQLVNLALAAVHDVLSHIRNDPRA